MGLRMSSAIADASFCSLGEVGFVSHTLDGRRSFIRGDGTLYYGRFRDDILFVGVQSRWLDFRSSFWRLRESISSVFEISFTTKSRVEIDFLQVHIEVTSGHLTISPKFKLKNQGVPLCALSAHPVSISRSWPIGVVKGYNSLSSSLHIAEKAREAFTSRLQQFHFPPNIVDSCRSLDMFEHRFRRPRPFVRTVSEVTWWLVLPYHPVLALARIQKLLDEVMSDPVVLAWFHVCFPGTSPRVRVAWRNAGRAAVHVFRSQAVRVVDPGR